MSSLSTSTRDWRKVHIQGTCSESDTDKAEHDLVNKEFCINNHINALRYTPSTSNGELGHWISSSMSSTGWLADSDLSVSDIGIELHKISDWYPSLNITVDVGDHHGNPSCEATYVISNGLCFLEGPRVSMISD